MNIIEYKIIFRGWAKNKIYPLISLLSLVVGITCSVLLVGFVMHENREAHATPGEERVYVVQGKDVFHNGEVCTYETSDNIGKMLHAQFPEIDNYCTFRQENAFRLLEGHEECIEHSYSVTPSFAEIFQPRLVAGDLRGTLSAPAEIAVSRSFALRTFGIDNAVGQTLFLKWYQDVHVPEGIYQEEVKQLFTITSVIDDRSPSVLRYDLLMGLSPSRIGISSRYSSYYYNIVQLTAGAELARLEEKVRRDSSFNLPLEDISFLPVDKVYYTRDYAGSELFRYRDYAQLQTGVCIALLILLIACFNHVNINMTRSFQRLRYSVQQLIHGASKQEIRIQVIQETSLQVGVAFCISLVAIYVLLPTFNSFMNARLSVGDLFNGQTFVVLIGLLGIVVLLPSLYIIVKLERMPLGSIMKKESLRHSRMVAGMVIVQFTISVVLLLFQTTIGRQMDYILHLRPDSETIIDIRIGSLRVPGYWKDFKDRLITLPGVMDYTSTWPLESGAISEPGFNANMLKMDDRFFRFYHVELLAGDSLYNSSSGTEQRVLVNEALVKRKNLTDPVGASIHVNGVESIISGVIRDYAIEHVSHKIQPLMIILDPEEWDNSVGAVIKTRPGEVDDVIARVKQLWKEIAPGEQPPSINTLAELYAAMHGEEYRTARIVEVFSWISLMLSCLGLFGLAWFSVASRTKEICLRKINGASERQIVCLVCGRFVKWILVASAIGVPVGLYLSREWLTQFVYKTELSPWTFIPTLLLVVMLGIVTVIRQSWHAATLSPIDSLKLE